MVFDPIKRDLDRVSRALGFGSGKIVKRHQYTIESEGIALEPLRRHLLPYLRQAVLRAEPEDIQIQIEGVELSKKWPFLYGSWDSNTEQLFIIVPGNIDFDEKDALAILAYSLGARANDEEVGLAWARKWNIIPQYLQAIRNNIERKGTRQERMFRR